MFHTLGLSRMKEKDLDMLTESMYISLKYNAMKMIKIFILALLITSCMPDGSQGPEQGSVLSADQTEIMYTLYGEGKTALVFVHGWCCDQEYWREQVDTFAREWAARQPRLSRGGAILAPFNDRSACHHDAGQWGWVCLSKL